MCKESESFPVTRTSETLLAAVEAFSWGLHRVIVIGDNGTDAKLMTQTDVVAYLLVSSFFLVQR